MVLRIWNYQPVYLVLNRRMAVSLGTRFNNVPSVVEIDGKLPPSGRFWIREQALLGLVWRIYSICHSILIL